MKNKLRRYWPTLIVILAALIFTFVSNKNNMTDTAQAAELPTAAATVEFLPAANEPTVITAVSAVQDTSLDSKKKDKKDKGDKETTEAASKETEKADDEAEIVVKKDGEYSDKDHVAAYIHKFGKLPANYLTKKQAEKLGWDGDMKTLRKVKKGASLGGSSFGNREGLLPDEKGRSYFECDIDFDGKSRPDTRIVYSNDGLIYYTEDRFKSFECLYDEDGKADEEKEDDGEITVEKDGEYSDKDHVAAYIHQYGKLPSNYITKKEAEKRGWVSYEKNLWDKNVAPGKSIGGSYFGNYEGILPTKKGRDYYECDIDFDGGGRNAKRIIYSNDGLIYYTEDHYETFELLYGEE